MAISNVSVQDQRIRNLVGARKRYSDFSKEKCKDGSQDKAKLRSRMQRNQEEIKKITEELEMYRRQYNKIIGTMGRAHKEAIFKENEEEIISELIRMRNNKVKSRAELVLLEEVHRSRLMDLKKQLEKEKLLKRRRDIFRMRSPPPKVKISKDYREKLEEWKQFENLVQQEINQLKEEKELTRLKRVQSDIVDKFDDKVRLKPETIKPKIQVKLKTCRNAQVQTDCSVENRAEIEKEVTHKVSVSSQIDSSTSGPFRTINMSLEDLLARRVAEKMTKMQRNVMKNPKMGKSSKDAAINTTRVEEEQTALDLSETCYLPLPCEKKIDNVTLDGKSKKDLNLVEEDDRSSLDLTATSVINLEELVSKVKHIKSLVDKAELPKEHKAVKTDQNQRSKHKSENNVSSTVQDTRRKLNTTFDKINDIDVISPVSTTSNSPLPTNSPLSSPIQSPPPSLSPPASLPLVLSKHQESSPLPSSSNSSRATIKKLDSQTSDLSLSSLSDDLSMEQGRFDDSSLSSVASFRSLYASINFSQFSKLLNVDTDKLWSDVMNSADVGNSSFSKTPVRKCPPKYSQSTPKVSMLKENSVQFQLNQPIITVFNKFSNLITVFA